MKDYSILNRSNKNRQKIDGSKLFDIQFYNGNDGRIVAVDGHNDLKMIVQDHTNPLNEGLLDKKAKFLSDSNIYRIGNIITFQDNNEKYMAVTNPKDNGVYSEYRIRVMNDNLIFSEGNLDTINIDCIMASGLLYKDGSYTNQSNVFEDNEMKAVIVQYNNETVKFSLFDSVTVNNRSYKIVKIDDESLKLYKNNYGILQLVLLLAPNSKIEKINVIDGSHVEFKGVTKYARVKDRKLNSVSRELLCEYGAVKTGDYIEYTFDSDDKGTISRETYIVFNVPSKYDGYDISLIYRCLNSFSTLDDKGIIRQIPYYFEDNRTRIDKTSESANINQLDSSFMLIMQENDLTKKFITKEVNRVLLKGMVYKVTGVSNHDEGLLHLGIEIDKFDISEDKNNVANYTSQMKKLNNEKGKISGESVIFKGFDWNYRLDQIPINTNTVWKVDSDKVLIKQMSGNSCVINIVKKYDMGTKFTLTATVSGNVYVKEITLE